MVIAKDHELQTTADRIEWFRRQVAHIQTTETDQMNCHAASSGFQAEIDRMQFEVREYLPPPKKNGA